MVPLTVPVCANVKERPTNEKNKIEKTENIFLLQ